MPELSTDEKKLICLALDEYAAGFSMTLTPKQAEQIKELAARLRVSKIGVSPTIKRTAAV